MKNRYDYLPNGYQETIEKGLNALHVFSRTSYGVGTREKQLKRLKAELKNANAIVIGAGAGLSTSAGLTYSGERFDRFSLISNSALGSLISTPAAFIRSPIAKHVGRGGQGTSISYDIFNHICEQYFSGEDDNTSDYIAEALMKSVVHSSLIAVKNPEDYEARSNIMWTATWALNTLIACGKSTDWMVHMIGQSVGAYTDATHGMTLAAVSLPYYRMIMPYGLNKFKRFATEVWGVSADGKTDEQIANEGLEAMKNWMKQLGVALSISELGATEDMLDGIADGTIILEGGYKTLTKEDVIRVLKDSL